MKSILELARKQLVLPVEVKTGEEAERSLGMKFLKQ